MEDNNNVTTARQDTMLTALPLATMSDGSTVGVHPSKYIEVLNLGIGPLLVALALPNDKQLFSSSQSLDGLTLLPKRNCSCNVVLLDTHTGLE